MNDNFDLQVLEISFEIFNQLNTSLKELCAHDIIMLVLLECSMNLIFCITEYSMKWSKSVFVRKFWIFVHFCPFLTIFAHFYPFLTILYQNALYKIDCKYLYNLRDKIFLSFQRFDKGDWRKWRQCRPLPRGGPLLWYCYDVVLVSKRFWLTWDCFET